MSGNLFRIITTDFKDDPATLQRNVNGLGGHALACWLIAGLNKAGCRAGEDWPEDHGWDFSIEHEGATYLCVCCIEPDQPEAGTVIIDKHRSLMDRLLGRNKLAPDDRVTHTVERLLRTCPGISHVGIETD